MAKELFAIHCHMIPDGSNEHIIVYREDELLEVLKKWGFPDPDWAGNAAEHVTKIETLLDSHPSNKIREFMEKLGIDESKLAILLNMSDKQLDRLLNKGGALSLIMADRLEIIFDKPAREWLQMQDEYLAKINEIFSNEKPSRNN